MKNIGTVKLCRKMNDFFDEAINLLTKDIYFFLQEEPRYVEGNYQSYRFKIGKP